jgi:hypothetical protein
VSEEDGIAAALRKIANLFALWRVADLKKGEAATVLDLAGFSYREIAALIGTSEGSVRGLLSASRKRAATED